MRVKQLITITALSLTCAFMATGASADAAKLNDAQIAHIAYTADDIEIRNAMLAIKKTHNKAVKTFAEEMARDHKSTNEKILALIKKLNVRPENNDTSKGLAAQQNAERANIAKLNEAEFDRAYAENEVAFQHTVNNTLETTLIPSAGNPELKGLLKTSLKASKGHEEHARHLFAELKKKK